ncbi:hypothetical protein MUK42_36917 [Musa troglodytarum]|uniref:Secreted protein n=1 Tax=Musa troglodytarum TaxID=320322 RepID=A0A9E7GBR2_9LILI|nr:hypothetical protein MUK42_36917 [Musa troglodytarum]
MRSIKKLLYFHSGFFFLLTGLTLLNPQFQCSLMGAYINSSQSSGTIRSLSVHRTYTRTNSLPLLGRACRFFLEGTDEAKLIRSGSFFGGMH